jgi:hypothetical protein
VTVPELGKTIDSAGLNGAPLVVQLLDCTAWKKIRLWHEAVLFAGRRRLAPSVRPSATGTATRSAAIVAATTDRRSTMAIVGYPE